MKTKLLNLIVALAFGAEIVTAAPLGSTFTYQGKLVATGQPANGSYDLKFTLYDDGSVGNVVGASLTNAATGVTNGLFTVAMDFGSGVFDGDPRWLEIGVRTNGGSVFTTLSPRQALSAVPYAIYAPNAGT
ncbi:MAG: hypothetical protein MUF81_18250, partial [Verrucomicrobia bacterium]|nr:hypothetical protein [Verrucomicrobiota bacterium]